MITTIRNDHPFDQARAVLRDHPFFGPLAHHMRVNRQPGNRCPPDGWAVVTGAGHIYANSQRTGMVEEWTSVLAHLLLHLGLDHVCVRPDPPAWNAACDVIVWRLLGRMGLPLLANVNLCSDWDGLDEETLYRTFNVDGIPVGMFYGVAGTSADMFPESGSVDTTNWPYWLSKGLRQAVKEALTVTMLGAAPNRHRTESHAQQARSWFIREYPLLAALASAFTIIEDDDVCQRRGIAIAAVQPALREIYINPYAGLDANETRFVVAHELLHVGLLHHRRRAWRHPFLWNIACDYVINNWLQVMRVGVMPDIQGLHDLRFHGLSAEAIYALIEKRLKELRMCRTLCGVGVGDVLLDGNDEVGGDLDAFLRRCLANGLDEQCRMGRGLLPAGLVEEVRGMLRPPIAWDVQLARWFDAKLGPHITRRSYARPSRRQSSTPDIPRPRTVEATNGTRTFGVVLDTSGSMDRMVLAAALGSVAGYAHSRDVSAIRLVFCDAQPHDRGYVPPEALLDRVDIRGRGGTVLQPAIDLLENAQDFPESSPILVITDGLCDELDINYEHAFLVPPGHSPPFSTGAPLFEMV